MSHKNPRLHQPHDAVFKQALSDIQVGRDLLRQHLPKALQALIDWESLRLDNTHYIDLNNGCFDPWIW